MLNTTENKMENEITEKSPGSSFINSPDKDVSGFWDNIFNDDFDEDQPLINMNESPETTPDQESTVNRALPLVGNVTTPVSVPEADMNKQVEEVIESKPTVAEQVTEEVSGEDSPIETEAEQLNDSNPNNDEVNNRAIEQTPVKEKQEILDKLNNAGSSFMNIPQQSEDIDFESFVNNLEDKEGSPKAKETLAKYNKVLQSYPPEVATMLSDKIKNIYTTFAKGKNAQATNMGNRFSNAGELLNAEEGRISKVEKDFWVDRINKALDDPEKLLKNSRGLNLRNPETRKYFEEKFGHDWVKKQDSYSLNRSLRNQNIEIARNAFKYLDKSLTTGKSKYDLTNDLINGRIDPEKIFTMPPTMKSNGARFSNQLLSKRKAAFDALKTIKENNEIRKYLQSRFDDIVDVSEYWNIPKEELLTNIRKQIVGIPEAEVLLSKDNEVEPKLDDKVEVEALEQVEKEYKENSQLPALNLQDYHKDLELNGERDLETLKQLPALNDERDLAEYVEDVDYTVVEDSDYITPVYTIEDLDKEIEEVNQWPVTNVDEAKAKQRKLMDLKSRRVAYGGTSKSDTNWNYDRSTATGGRVSPRAGIGSIGGAAGHGSMASTSSTKMGDSHNSIASKAPLPHALEDNQGRVVSINGKATTAPSSNNNGAFRSGSFGLMSKASSNLKSVPSKAPVSGGAKHTGNSTIGANGMPEVGSEAGKQALIERLEQLLAQLTDEEKKEFGFSSSLNQWNGKSLSKLDGYTLQDLIDKVEEYLEEK